MTVRTRGPWFVDEYGRTLLLRGVNLSGSSKVPFAPNGATHRSEGFFDHRAVSFVGRPFPLEEADEHLRRLRAWGLTFLRLLVTWEAIEHGGPGVYDEEYLDYLRAIVQKAGEVGFKVLIDPHQDVWSRFSGGDGAPGWTLEAAGLDLTRFQESGAAIVHQTHGDPFPRMIWPTNGSRLAAATMCTLFFGGNDFAPKTLIADEPAQEYLQRHYIAAFRQVAERLKGLDNVVGYEPMNEPTAGFIGCRDLTSDRFPVKFGPEISPLQTMLLGSGIPQVIDIWQRTLLRSRLVERKVMNPRRVNVWRAGYPDIWRENGVWDLDEREHAHLLRPDHFARVNGREVDFSRDYLRPFANRFAAEIRQVDPDALLFIEFEPRAETPLWSSEDVQSIVFAPHWYDVSVLFLKTFTPLVGFDVFDGRVVFGPRRISRSFAAQLARYKEYAARCLGNAPTLIGEIGISYDLNHRIAYRTGNFTQHVRAMDRTLRAADDNLLSYTLWNYTPDNDNAHGDQWNGEDLSIYSPDQRRDPADIHSGGRALEAVVRPYPRATAGEPVSLSFDIRRKVFSYAFRHDPAVQAPTEIFVPAYHYPQGVEVLVSDGTYEIRPEEQALVYTHDPAQPLHRVQIIPRRGSSY